jgi:hypothetical protein
MQESEKRTAKKVYTKPSLKKWGTVADLTKSGVWSPQPRFTRRWRPSPGGVGGSFNW